MRRVRRELAWPMQDAGPDALWAHRFLLSRLQAHVAALDQTPDGDRAAAPIRLGVPSGPADWLEALGRRRDELADAADERMAAMAPRDRREPCTRAVAAAFDEIGEMTAFLEHMPPHRAVRRLELAREDLERLGTSCRLWARPSPRGIPRGRRGCPAAVPPGRRWHRDASPSTACQGCPPIP